MDSEVVSPKMLFSCILISIGILIIKGFVDNTTRTQIYICNSQKGIEVYARHDKKDLIIAPLNIKNLLGCMGRSMPYYDRTLEVVLGDLRVSDKDILSQRYSLPLKGENSNTIFVFEKSAVYISGDYQTLLFRKDVDLNVLKEALRLYPIRRIILSESQKDISYINALEKSKVEIKYVRMDEAIKI